MSSRQPPSMQSCSQDRQVKFNGGRRGFKKIHIPALPAIGLEDGPNIPHIRDALQHYTQLEIGGIAEIFSEGRYKDLATVVFTGPTFVAYGDQELGA